MTEARILGWEDPSRKLYKDTDAELAQALSREPGRWAIVCNGISYREAENVRSRLNVKGLSVAVRSQEDGSHNVYARYKVKEEA